MVCLLDTRGDPTCARLACSLISDSLISGTRVVNGNDHGENCSGESWEAGAGNRCRLINRNLLEVVGWSVGVSAAGALNLLRDCITMAIGLDDVVIDYSFQLIVLSNINVSGVTKHLHPFFRLDSWPVTLTCCNCGKPIIKYDMKLCCDGASLRIQDKWHCAGMFWWVPHVDSLLRSWLPLRFFFPLPTVLSNTYIGHPQAWQSWNFFCSHLIFVKRSTEEILASRHGMWLYKYVACVTAISHWVASVASGQCMAACSIIMRAMLVLIPIARSAIPLWWWAPVPANIIICANFLSFTAMLSDVKIVALLESYTWGTTPWSWHTCSNSWIALSISCTFKLTWSTGCPLMLCSNGWNGLQMMYTMKKKRCCHHHCKRHSTIKNCEFRCEIAGEFLTH
jgi:hypothetical protein